MAHICSTSPVLQELKTAKEAVAQLENGEDGSEPWNRFPGSRLVAAASDMREAVETGERELAELRAIVTRKGVCSTLVGSF